MRFFTLFLLQLTSFSLGSKNENYQNILCNFTSFGNLRYGCYLRSANITRDDVSLKFNTNHAEWKTDDDVLIISSMVQFAGIIEVFHPQLIQKFRNLQRIALPEVKMKRFVKKSFDSCSSIVDIDLSSNYLNTIPDKLFSSCRNLRILDLRYNLIFEVGDFGFFGLDNLEELNLAYNRVTFSQKAIRNLTKLKRIYLQNFWLKGDEDLSIFQHLENLEVIDLSCFHPSFYLVEKLTDGLENLREISLTFNYYLDVNFEFLSQFDLTILNLGSNAMIDIPEYSFRNLTNLTILGISFNYLQEISECTFCGLKNLEQLYISYNSIDKIHTKAFDNLRRLFLLDINLNKIEYLTPRHFKCLGNLQYLAISGNRIYYFMDHTFKNLANLMYFLFNENMISSLNSNAFGRHKNLTYISAVSNMIYEIDENFFDNFPNLESFYGMDNLCYNGYTNNFTAINKTEIFHQCFSNWQLSNASPAPPHIPQPDDDDEETTTVESKGSKLKISLTLVCFVSFIIRVSGFNMY